MKKQILDRYMRTQSNKLLIDITAGKVEDLYDDFDRHAPYVRKELEQNLVDYIIDCVSEIGKEDFVIQFRLNTITDESLMERVKSSIHNYFSYLIDRELREFESMRHTSFILFIIGVSILFLSVWIDNKTAGENSVITHMFAEGLYVASWVSLWHAIATFLINWAPHRKKVKLYRRISSANIQFYNVELASVEDVPQLSAVF